MSDCDHHDKTKLICLYEGCKQPNILMCKFCFFETHSHPNNPCVRIDYLEQAMAPYIRISEKKQTLQEDLEKAIEKKKIKLIAYMDEQLKRLKQQYLDNIQVPELSLFNLIKEEKISNDMQKMVRTAVANNQGVGLQVNYQKLDDFQRVINEIDSAYQIVNVQKSNNKRPHDGVEIDQKCPESRKKRLEKTSINIDQDVIVLPVRLEASPYQHPFEQDQISIPPNKPYLYTNFTPAQDHKDEEEINEQITVQCEGFQQAIKELQKRKKVQIFKIEILASNKSEPKKFCSTFFQNLQQLKKLQLLDLKISKPFLMYDFLSDSLVKSLSKLNYLRQLYLQFTTKTDLKDYLMPKFQKKLMKKNIHLKIHKPDMFN